MSSYANQKDDFLSDSGLWNDDAVNGSNTLTGGARVMAKTSVGWGETGLRAINGRTPIAGDGIEWDFTLNDIASASMDVNNVLMGFRVGGNTDYNTILISVYPYWDNSVGTPGVKLRGYTFGLATDSILDINLVEGETYTIKVSIDPSTGELTIQAKGGVIGASYQNLSVPNGVDARGYGVWRFQTNLYNTGSDISISRFEWYDSGGPDVPAGSSDAAVDHPCQMCNSQGWL